MTTEQSNPKLIHIARVFNKEGRVTYLFLRKLGAYSFAWFQETTETEEIETELTAPTIEEALLLANRKWKNQSYRRSENQLVKKIQSGPSITKSQKPFTSVFTSLSRSRPRSGPTLQLYAHGMDI